jgi:hypothetical protein
LQGADAGQLAGWVETGFDFGDAGLLGDGRGRFGGVAGEHEHAQAGSRFGQNSQRGDGSAASGRKRVARVEVAHGACCRAPSTCG